MQTVIFAGGLGTRFSEMTDLVPKPLIKIGEDPILVHIMRIYIQQGHKDFVIAGGYKVAEIKKYFLEELRAGNDIEINYRTKEVVDLSTSWLHDAGISIKVIDTGLSTQTGSRLLRLKDYLDDTFMLTYGDGLGNVDFSALRRIHHQSKSLITITGVKPKSRYGKLVADGSSIHSFVEKPQFDSELVNAGFMMVEKGFLDFVSNADDIMIEEAPFKKAIKLRKMHVYEHRGFWHPMDTLRDQRKLNEYVSKGQVPWLEK